MKRIVFCFDGSWNALDSERPTNVVLVAESVEPFSTGGVAQIIHYDDGVGTGGSDWKFTQVFDRWTGGLLGWGLLDNIREAYRFLIFNYEIGDEIFVFGFSRGAYTARSFVGLIRCASIPRRRDAQQITKAIEFYRNRKSGDFNHLDNLHKFRAEFVPDMIIDDAEDHWRATNVEGHLQGRLPRLLVQYVGIWDTVGALGLPARLKRTAARFNARHQFHDPELPDFVINGRHAVALDERRGTFAPTLWDNLEQRLLERGVDPASPDAPLQEQWFPGTHGSVGGGGDVRGLSDGALGWIIEGARAAGLELDTTSSSRVYELRPDYRAPLINYKAGPDKSSKLMSKRDRAGPTKIHHVHISAIRRWGTPAEQLPEQQPYRPASLARVAAELGVLSERLKAPRAASVMAHHTVEPGDTLRGLALRYHGSADLASNIFDANRHGLDDPNVLHVGTILDIPEVGLLTKEHRGEV